MFSAQSECFLSFTKEGLVSPFFCLYSRYISVSERGKRALPPRAVNPFVFLPPLWYHNRDRISSERGERHVSAGYLCHRGWQQPHAPRFPRPASAFQRGRRVYQRRFRLSFHALQGHRRRAAALSGGGVRSSRADLPPQGLQRVQGGAQADRAGIEAAVRPCARVSDENGGQNPDLPDLRGRRHPRHVCPPLRGGGDSRPARHGRPRFHAARHRNEQRALRRSRRKRFWRISA